MASRTALPVCARHLGAWFVWALLIPAGLAAQETAPPVAQHRYWLNAGLGIGRTRDSHAGSASLTAGLSLTYQPGLALVTLRSSGVWGVLDGDVITDLALLAGVGTHGRRSHLSLAAGPALAGGSLGFFHSDASQFSPRLGLGIQAQAFGIAFDALGLGLTGFANLNSRQSFGGVTLGFAFGQLAW